MARFISGLNNFSVVLGAGFCIWVACILLASGSEALFHRDLPLIGWYLPIYYGGKMLVNSSRLRRGRVMMCVAGYTGMFAVILYGVLTQVSHR